MNAKLPMKMVSGQRTKVSVTDEREFERGVDADSAQGAKGTGVGSSGSQQHLGNNNNPRKVETTVKKEDDDEPGEKGADDSEGKQKGGIDPPGRP